MTSAKYIGYLGGAAVAAGVGAAIAVAVAASANAESADGEAAAAPAKAEAKPDHPKPLEKLTDRIEKVAAEVTKKASAKQTPPSTSKPDDANISATQITVRRPPPSPRPKRSPTTPTRSGRTIRRRSTSRLRSSRSETSSSEPHPKDSRRTSAKASSRPIGAARWCRG